MIRTKTVLLTLAVLLCAAPPAQAFFDNLMVSPRTRAMGDVSVSVPDAPFAAYLNPAYLGQVSEGTIGTSYLQPYGLGFTDLGYLGGAIPLSEKAGAIGLGFRYFVVDYESTFEGNTEKNKLLEESTYTISHGIGLFRDVHSTVDLGYGLNFYRLSQGTDLVGEDPGDGWAVGLDLALLVSIHERTRIGAMVKNVNSPRIGSEREDLERRVNGGISYEPYRGVITTFELESQLGEKVQYHGGVEMVIFKGFALRAGVMTSPSKVSAGFGYVFRGVALNYGYSTGGGALDSSHQFGLNYYWGGEVR